MYKTLKYILSLVVVTLSFNNLYSQAITLSVEIIWKEKALYYLGYDKVNIPFLKITYKNNSENSLYFYNHTDTMAFLHYAYLRPMINYGSGYDPQTPWKVLTDSFPDWSKKKYNVLIEKIDDYYSPYGYSHVYAVGSQRNKNPYESYIIEYEVLQDLTDLLKSQSKLNRENTNLQYEYFHYPDKDVIERFHYSDINAITQEEFEKMDEEFKRGRQNYKEWQSSDEYKVLILERDSMDNGLYPNKVSARVYRLIEKDIEQRCIFLKPHESFSFEFDLTPFFLLKGSYNFIIKSQKLPKSVTFSNPYIIFKEYSFKDEKIFNPKYNDNIYTFKLPSMHKGYKLYTRKINEVKIRLYLKN